MSAQISPCPHCGAPVNLERKYCSNCGNALHLAATEINSRAARFFYFLVQFVLALGAMIFGGVSACSTYALATHQAVSRDIGDLSGMFWFVGLVALSCCAACVFVAVRRKKP